MEVHPVHRTNHHRRVSGAYAVLSPDSLNRPVLYLAVQGRAERSNQVESDLTSTAYARSERRPYHPS